MFIFVVLSRASGCGQMDIVRVHNTRPYLFSEDPQDFDEESEMASAGNQIQGDYSGYVPPEVVVTSDAAVPTSPRRKSSQTKQTSEKVRV